MENIIRDIEQFAESGNYELCWIAIRNLLQIVVNQLGTIAKFRWTKKDTLEDRIKYLRWWGIITEEDESYFMRLKSMGNIAYHAHNGEEFNAVNAKKITGELMEILNSRTENFLAVQKKQCTQSYDLFLSDLNSAKKLFRQERYELSLSMLRKAFEVAMIQILRNHRIPDLPIGESTAREITLSEMIKRLSYWGGTDELLSLNEKYQLKCLKNLLNPAAHGETISREAAIEAMDWFLQTKDLLTNELLEGTHEKDKAKQLTNCECNVTKKDKFTATFGIICIVLSGIVTFFAKCVIWRHKVIMAILFLIGISVCSGCWSMAFNRGKSNDSDDDFFIGLCAFVLGIWGAICGGTISSSFVGATIGLIVVAILCNLAGVIVRRESADVFLLIQIAFAIGVNQWIQNGFDKCIVVFVAFILPVGFAIHLKEKRNNVRERKKQERKQDDLLAWIAVDEQIPQKQI